ncbi:type II toxin-antitoxin system Phd/YefM family antitoxin [bacterium]|nr:type II toxin-antitoxin system Phd/YefM family antitoxin [bacterium]
MIEKTASEARQNFAELINQVAFGGERVMIHRHGKELAAVVPMGDLSLLNDLETRIDLDDARNALKEAQEQGTVSLEELKQQLGL